LTKLILALNVGTKDNALEWLERVGNQVDLFKLQMDLFGRVGPELVRHFVQHGASVFLDLKFCDIPSVVGKAVEAVAELGVSMLTVHTIGGQKMLEAAAAASKSGTKKPLILGVTVLTSISNDELAQLTGAHYSVKERVLSLARLAQDSGCDGVVASPEEVSLIKQACGKGFLVVTPGIRLKPSSDDQSRYATPGQAASSGADYIVVGRPIYQAQDPIAVIKEIKAQIEGSNG